MALTPLNFLVIDDCAEMRQMIKDVIGDLAGNIFEAADGEESLRLYRDKHPDWVLMDLMMPGIDGLQATEQIKLEHPDARIIIVTNHDRAVFRDAARRAGAVGYVLKDDLSRIRDYFESSKSALPQ